MNVSQESQGLIVSDSGKPKGLEEKMSEELAWFTHLGGGKKKEKGKSKKKAYSLYLSRFFI